MSQSALELMDVTVQAGGRTILAVDGLRVAAGEVFAVLGPNGAGKSTLLKCCLGLVRPRTGRVEVLGQSVHRLTGGGLAALRCRIGYVAQDLAGAGEMPLTLREVVAIGRTGRAGLCRRLRAADWALVDTWIDRLGLTPLARSAYGDLSGGEQRKTLIARAMVQEPELLVLDEPTAHLDLGWREQMVSLMEQLYIEESLTLILVCHELEVIPACCRRMGLLEAGRLAAIGRPEEVLTEQRVAELYGAGLSVRHQRGRHAVVPAAIGRTA